MSDVAYLTHRHNNIRGLPKSFGMLSVLQSKSTGSVMQFFSVVNFECPACCCCVALCGCWFSWSFSDYRTIVQKATCSDFLLCYKGDGGSLLSQITSEEETWIHHFELQTKDSHLNGIIQLPLGRRSWRLPHWLLKWPTVLRLTHHVLLVRGYMFRSLVAIIRPFWESVLKMLDYILGSQVCLQFLPVYISVIWIH